MGMPRKGCETLTSVEIGTSTVKVVVGGFLPDDVLSILGVGTVPSLKVVKGCVREAAVVQEQLEQALLQAEHAAGVEIGDVILAVTGGDILSTTTLGSSPVQDPESRIEEEDLITAVRNARAFTLPPDRQVVHYLDRRYFVDGLHELSNPIGQVGSRLEAELHVVYGEHNLLETRCGLLAEALGVPAVDMAFSAVAAAFGVFTREELEHGSCVIDIGAGCTEYAVFHGAGCFHSGQVAVGCDHIVNDLSVGLRLPMPKCRKILHDLGTFGSAVMNPDGRTRLMEVSGRAKDKRLVPISTIEQIIELRLQELFEVILHDLRERDAVMRINGAVALVGGGALIPDIDRLAAHVLKMPAVVSRARLVSGPQEVITSPVYVTPLGLLRWGRFVLEIGASEDPGLGLQLKRDFGNFRSILRRAFNW